MFCCLPLYLALLGGSKIARFVRFPTVPVPIPDGSSSSLIQLSSSTFDGLVSTIDVAPTISDLAGISESKRYNMDGKSWMVRLLDTTTANANDHNDRCLFVEADEDRSVRCGCYKYISIQNTRSGRTVNWSWGGLDRDNYYYLCDEETDTYISSIERSPERSQASKNIFPDSIRDQLKEKIKCHKEMTDPSKNPNYKLDCGLPLKHPTTSPTKSPTTSPTTKPPTNSPTTKPASQPPSASPSSKPSASPTDASSKPSASPTDAPPSPTKEPTDATLPPTTPISQPTPSPINPPVCENSNDIVYVNKKGKKKKCNWVKAGKTLKIRRKRCIRKKYSYLGKRIKENCPKACGKFAGKGICKNLFVSPFGKNKSK